MHDCDIAVVLYSVCVLYHSVVLLYAGDYREYHFELLVSRVRVFFRYRSRLFQVTALQSSLGDQQFFFLHLCSPRKYHGTMVRYFMQY